MPAWWLLTSYQSTTNFFGWEICKECMDATVKIICPEVEIRLKNVSLSRRTIVRRVDSISTNLADQLASKIKKFDYFSSCLDESTDVVDTAQMLIFIRGATEISM